MTIPGGAIFEGSRSSADGETSIVIYDVSHLLEKEAAKIRKPSAKPYGMRNVFKIDTCIMHKSGGNGPPGYKGALATMRYVVAHRGWWGAVYTLWISREPDIDDQDRIVVYRCQPDEVRSWHTGGRMNRVGISIGIQGNYDGQWDLLSNGLPKIDREPTDTQWRALTLLVPWIVDTYPKITIGRIDEDDDWGLTGHWEVGSRKRVCPGDALRKWVETIRGEGLRTVTHDGPVLPEICTNEVDPFRFTPKQYQKALLILEFNPGPIDGKPGPLTRQALELFQNASGLKPDGWFGLDTAHAMQQALRHSNFASQQAFDSEPPQI